LNVFKEYKSLVDTIHSGKEILAEESDEELREMAHEEMEMAEEKFRKWKRNIKMLLVPADPEDSKNAILEIVPEPEATRPVFLPVILFRMYSKFCEKKGWRMEVTNINEGTAGGYKEIVANVTGEGVYGI
jgi:peptide chain release factor 1